MPSTEKINTASKETHEQETVASTDTLRHSLLSASEARSGFVMIPRDTVIVEMNSNALSPESFQGLSSLVEEVNEEPTFSSSINLQKRGYGKLGLGNFMSSIDHTARRELKKDETSSNLTFLYDGSNVDMDGKTFIPSAILVHEDMSELQIQELREKLPAGVPLIDGKTNQLLDEVGQAEREQGRRISRMEHGFGKFALKDIIGSVSSFTDESYTYDWAAAEAEFDEDDGDDSKVESDTKVADLPTPESPEVQAYAKAQEIIADKSGGRDWAELSEAEQRSVRRQVIRETHPDFEGGDANVFRAAQDSMDLKSRYKR